MARMWHMQYYGSATVGERGQMVIPAEARKALDINPGEKMVVFGGPGGRLVAVKADAVSRFVTKSMTELAELERRLRAEEAEEE